MATRLELLLEATFKSGGIDAAIAKLKELGSSLESTKSREVEVDISVDKSEVVATQEEITDLANLPPLDFLTDDTEIVASGEEIRMLSNIDTTVRPGFDNSNIVAGREEISALASMPSLVKPGFDNSNIVAGREEIAMLASLTPTPKIMTDDSEIVASGEEIRMLSNIDATVQPGIDNSNIVAGREEITALANNPPVIFPRVDPSAGIASIEEIHEEAGRPVTATVNIETAGGEEAIAQIEAVAAAAAQASQAGGGGVPPTGEIDGVMKLAKEYDDLAEARRKEARAAADGSDGSKQRVDDLNKEARMLASKAETMRNLANRTKTSTMANVKRGKSLDDLIRDLELTARAEEKLVEQLILEGKHSDAQVIAKRAKATNQLRNEYDRLNQSLHKVNAITRTTGQEMQERFGDVKTMKEFKNRVKEVSAELKEMKAAALAGADGINQMLKVAEKEEALKKLTTAGLGMDMTFKLLGKDLGIMGGIMQSKFNQLGFLMFITLNSIKSVIGAFKTLKNVIIAVADTQNFMNAWTAAATRAGLATDEFRLSLNDAAGGFISWNEAQRIALELNLRGGESAAEYADEILELSKKLDIATGGVQAFADTQQALMSAFITGDVSPLNEVLGLQEVPAELELIEMAAERAGTPLSEMGKKEAGIRLLEDALVDLVPVLGDVADAGERSREKVAALAELGPSLGRALGIGLAAAFVGGPADDAQNSIDQFAADAIIGLFNLGFGVMQALGGIVVIGVGLISGALIDVAEKIGAVKAILDGGNVWDNLKIIGNPLSRIDTMIDTTTEMMAAWQENLDETRAKFEQTILGGMGLLEGESNEAITKAQDDLDLFNKGLIAAKNLIDNTFGDVKTTLDFLESPENDFREDLEDAEIVHRERLEKISEESVEALNKIRDKGAADWEKAQLDYNSRSEDLAEGLTDKILDINEDNEFKVGRLREDAEDKRNNEKAKSNKKLEKIEIDHQRKIDDIMRRFGLSRLKALIDRDARALFEAERKRDDDLRKAEEQRKQKKDDEIQATLDRIKAINAAEEKSIRRANEDAQRKRDDAVKNHQKAMSDLEDQLEERHQLILDKMQDDRIARATADEKRSADEKKAHKKRTDKMKADFKETQGLLAAALLASNIAWLESHSTTTDGWFELWQQVLSDTREFKPLYGIEVGEINDITKSLIPIGFGDGGGGGGGGDVGGSDPVDNCVTGAQLDYTPKTGEGCSQVVAGSIITACDGSKWVCDRGGWYPAGTNVQADRVEPKRTLNGIQSGGGSFGSSTDSRIDSIGGNGQIPVTIVIEGDKTVEQIFKEAAYTAYIEVIE